MALKKDKNKQCGVTITSEDLTQVSEESILIVTDHSGKYGINMWMYAEYFHENIQEKITSGGMLYIDGIRLDKYKEYFVNEKKYLNITNFLEDSICSGLQQEMQDLHDTHINWVALYGLCMYIREIIDRKLALLFKPTIRETLEEIGDKDNLDSITFNLKRGDSHNSDFYVVKEQIINALKNCNDESCEFHKIVRKVDIYTKEYSQIEFVKYISKFFREYFPNVKRRKNSRLTTTEQRIICYLLKFFEFTPEVVQESRFRQLINSKYKPTDHYMPLQFLGLNKAHIYLEFIPYSIWKLGKINPMKCADLHKQNLQKNLTLNMGETPDISELLKVIDGMFG